MANFYFDVSYISRNQGRSASAAAAYRSGERLNDDYYGRIHDYTHKAGILYTKIFLTPTAPREYNDRQTFVNAIEKAEKRCDSRLFREIKASLPNELKLREQIELVEEYVIDNFVANGMCADVVIHEGKHTNNPKKNNPHIHILLSTRTADSDGFCTKKNRDWDKRANVILWREQWSRVQNREYERNGFDVRVSHESLYVQGIDREPAPYLCRTDWQREKRGEQTPRGDERRAVKARNKEREEYKRQHEREQYREHARSRSR